MGSPGGDLSAEASDAFLSPRRPPLLCVCPLLARVQHVALPQGLALALLILIPCAPTLDPVSHTHKLSKSFSSDPCF